MSNPESQPRDISGLLDAARKGDRVALDRIVQHCYGPVERAVHQRLQLRFRGRNHWIPAAFSTGDIVHSVFLRVLSSPLRLDHPTEETLIGYLVKTIENQIVDMTRFHQARRRDVRREQRHGNNGNDGSDVIEPVALAAARGGTPSRAAVGNEHMSIYTEILEGFADRERRVLKLRLEQQCSFEDVAKQVGFKSADVARKAFHGAKAKLLVRLRARGLDPNGGDTQHG